MADAGLGLRCPCGADALVEAWTYDAPPAGETRFPALAGRPYRRVVRRCAACEHHLMEPPLDPEELYRGAYVDATYRDGLRGAFERVVALAPERSDNDARVRRVVDFAATRAARGRAGAPTALDVGSGLAVFPHRLAREGWEVTALDPDPRAVAHAREVVGVPAVCADLASATGLGRHDAVTLNKVLEHVADPVAMLARASDCLRPGGFVYVEVPDGPAAAADGPGREEFFVEHLHAFSPASLEATIAGAGLRALRIERLREPSGKYTLLAFAEPTSATEGGA